ncbi:putative lipoprotein LpqN [Sediminihabitans luteus]|uniref:Putative lipoprotein LpqN n=1 Tax=Sediminihabitans luteus TaxID=1138585 RepID=A0A2M9CZQ4_9CELL|nr:LpqN/LpqT family lipoprotein [Sediminihabitans luteus]PJJ77305.1 putative lipoprotein LpqN [Sediminihabitans luteus]GII98756.1 hypothetical protein Slu03_11340 [Sediminihabitans luteus]
MTSVAYPSPQFPGPPQVGLEIPDGWSPVVGLGPAITVERDAGTPSAKVEVVVTRLRDWESLDEASMRIAGALEKLPGYDEIARDADDVAGHPGFRLDATVQNPAGGTFVQAIRYALVERENARDLVQVMGSCAGAQRDPALAEIHAIQDSLTIG